MIHAAIDAGALLKMVYASVIAGVGVTVVFSLAILGATRSSERRSDHGPGATAYAALAVVSIAVCLAAVAYGLYLVAHK